MKVILTHFKPLFHLYTPWKEKKTSGCIEMELWLGMGSESVHYRWQYISNYIPAFKNELLSIRECLVRKPAFIATLEKEIRIQFRMRVPNLRK